MTLAKTLGTAVLGLISLGLFSNVAVAETSAPLLDKVPPGTVLTIGDPVTQKALEVSGLIKELTFEVKWANLSGGPQTSEAFRAHALDVGSVAEIPSIFATWNDLPVRNIAYRERKDPIANPIYRFGIAPGVDVKSLADFRGKRIAFSPGQAQGTLVLRALHAAGLTKKDATLVELRRHSPASRSISRRSAASISAAISASMAPMAQASSNMACVTIPPISMHRSGCWTIRQRPPPLPNMSASGRAQPNGSIRIPRSGSRNIMSASRA